MNAPECPRCRQAMKPGFVLDKGHGDSPKQQEWQEGPPIKSFWHGMESEGRERHPVLTFRCERCGYLESYANDVPL